LIIPPEVGQDISAIHTTDWNRHRDTNVLPGRLSIFIVHLLIITA